ncbi:hypothetical protein [Streptomyces sp. NBC_01483]|nr:hypothetical protein [Streptomyces sp. NBC_01483]
MREHIDRTVGNFVDLMAEDPNFDIIPTMQGWRPADYEPAWSCTTSTA